MDVSGVGLVDSINLDIEKWNMSTSFNASALAHQDAGAFCENMVLSIRHNIAVQSHEKDILVYDTWWDMMKASMPKWLRRVFSEPRSLYYNIKTYYPDIHTQHSTWAPMIIPSLNPKWEDE